MRGYRVVRINKKLIEEDGRYYWAFCISYIEALIEKGAESKEGYKKKGSTDYKEVLDEPAFKRFVALKQIRKEVADANGLPYYAVFTNEELSQIARSETCTEKTLINIPGIGKKKVERWGKFFINYADHEEEQGIDTPDNGL